MTVPVDVDGVGFTDFLLDAGVYGAAITPSLRERLGLAPTDGAAVTALASGATTTHTIIVALVASVYVIAEAALDALCNEISAYYFQRQEEVSPSAAVDAIGEAS